MIQQRCPNDCEALERDRHRVCNVCSICRFPIVSLEQMVMCIEQFHRHTNPFSARNAGALLGIALQHEFPHALRDAKRLTQAINPDTRIVPVPTIVQVVNHVLGCSPDKPLLVTCDEFLDMCDSMTRAIPAFEIEGFPGVLWYQMLLFCSIDVLPRSFCEDETTFPIPTNMIEGKTPGFRGLGTHGCLYLAIRRPYYERNQRMRCMAAAQHLPLTGFDPRRYSTATRECVRQLDLAVPLAGSTLLDHLSRPLVCMILDYWIGDCGSWFRRS